jgi:hypothetical protein
MIINPFEFNDNLINLFHINNKLPALIIFNIIGILFLSYGLYRQYNVCQSNFNLFIIFIGIFNILLGCSLFLMRIFNFFIYSLFLVTIVYITILFLLMKSYVIQEHFGQGSCMNNTGYSIDGKSCIVDGINIDIKTAKEIPGTCIKNGNMGYRLPDFSNECITDTQLTNKNSNGTDGDNGNSKNGDGEKKQNNIRLTYEEKMRKWTAKQVKLNKKRDMEKNKREYLESVLKTKNTELYNKYKEFGGCFSRDMNQFDTYCNQTCNRLKEDRGSLVCEVGDNELIKPSKRGYETVKELPIYEDNSNFFLKSNVKRCNDYRINDNKLVEVENNKYHVDKCKQVPTNAFIDNKKIVRTDCFQNWTDYNDTNTDTEEAESRCNLYGQTLDRIEMCLPIYKNGEMLYGVQKRGICKQLK